LQSSSSPALPTIVGPYSGIIIAPPPALPPALLAPPPVLAMPPEPPAPPVRLQALGSTVTTVDPQCVSAPATGPPGVSQVAPLPLLDEHETATTPAPASMMKPRVPTQEPSCLTIIASNRLPPPLHKPCRRAMPPPTLRAGRLTSAHAAMKNGNDAGTLTDLLAKFSGSQGLATTMRAPGPLRREMTTRAALLSAGVFCPTRKNTAGQRFAAAEHRVGACDQSPRGIRGYVAAHTARRAMW